MGHLRTIRIFEDTAINLALSDQEIRDILALRSVIGDHAVNLQADGRLLMSHYVGFAQINHTRLLIYPKYARAIDHEEGWNQSFGILLKLLLETGFLGVKQLPAAQEMAQYQGDILEILISLFIKELLRLFQRDINRGYQDTHSNEPFVRGKIDFANHIRHNSYRKHIHSLIYEHFTENILMNQIFKSVLLKLGQFSRLRENRIRIGQALIWLEDIESITLTDAIWDQVVFTRLNHPYQVPFRMARLFYQNASITLNSGDTQSLSFLVPLNRLFEQYVYKIIHEAASPLDRIVYQGPVNYLAYHGEKPAFQLRPDISVLRQNQVHQIFDAKYKEIVLVDHMPKIAMDDLYQMLAYGVRYDRPLITLVYPAMMGQTCDELLVSRFTVPMHGQILTIRIMLIDLQKEVAQTVNTWRGMFEQDYSGHPV
ncbi:MAG: hypothetical protein PHQ83_06515 [Eubacteriales bacterium]|nr:hypothetical protein [Eubacteriales bacterium]